MDAKWVTTDGETSANPFVLLLLSIKLGFMDSPVYDFMRSSAVFYFTQIYDQPCAV
jgi:hypothetical protein